MARYLAGRFLVTLVLVFTVSSAAFLVTRLAPGDVAQTTLGFGASEATLAQARRQANLDRPVLVQWALWARSVAQLDLGTSTLYRRSVTSLVGERALNTALLATLSFVLALGLGIPAGFVTATRPRSAVAATIRIASLMLVSVPPFIGSLALVLLAVRTGFLPAGGITSATGTTGVAFALDVMWHLPVPVLALALPLAATFERLQAQALGEALREPAIRAARARGIPESAVLWRHAWRLSIKPVAGVAGLACGALLSGSFVVELVTSWPGLGRLTYDALMHRDLELVAGCAAAGALLLAIGLLAADAVVAWSDPRVRMPRLETVAETA